MGKMEVDLLKTGAEVEGRWKIKEKLGNGGFGQVYRAVDTEKGKEVAVKVEPRGKKEVLALEAKVMEAMHARPNHIPAYYGVGGNSSINFLVMEVLGKNLSDLRRDSPGQRACFSLRTAFGLAIQSLEALEDFHSVGFLHRDIKPGNFVMGSPKDKNKSVVFLIDYGLARPLYDKAGNLRPARPPGGFRGTVKYASPAAHDCKDLGRKDDLYSHFYMTLEMARGTLPWRRLKDKGDVGRCKKNTPNAKLCEELSPTIVKYGDILDKLEYASEPPYKEIRGTLDGLLKEALGKTAVTPTASTPLHRSFPLDWEEDWATLLKEFNDNTRVLGRLPSAAAITRTGAATGKTSHATDNSHPIKHTKSKDKKEKKTKKIPSPA